MVNNLDTESDATISLFASIDRCLFRQWLFLEVVSRSYTMKGKSHTSEYPLKPLEALESGI